MPFRERITIIWATPWFGYSAQAKQVMFTGRPQAFRTSGGKAASPLVDAIGVSYNPSRQYREVGHCGNPRWPQTAF